MRETLRRAGVRTAMEMMLTGDSISGTDAARLGWANHDHHTFRCSRRYFPDLVRFMENLGLAKRERVYAGAEAGWGGWSQVRAYLDQFGDRCANELKLETLTHGDDPTFIADERTNSIFVTAADEQHARRRPVGNPLDKHVERAPGELTRSPGHLGNVHVAKTP